MPLMVYHPSISEDMLLSKAYTDIMWSRDADKLLSAQHQTLSGFLRLCQPPNVVIYGIDDGAAAMNGIWLWSIVEPCYSGAFFSLWIKPEKRHTKQALKWTLDLYSKVLEESPVLLGITHQETLLEEHESIGYSILGKVPYLWGGNDVWVMQVTKESFHRATASLREQLQQRELGAQPQLEVA